MPAESREVRDTVVAVTGASSGIGAATKRLLLEAGAKVAVTTVLRQPRRLRTPQWQLRSMGQSS